MQSISLATCMDEAEKLISQGKNNEALQLLNKVALDERADWKLFWLIAQAAKNIGHIEIVDQACKMVIELNPDFWFARELPKHARGYYSQLGQDEIIERFFAEHTPKNRVFVEVGAFDGVHYSNVRRLRETHGWSGVSIEPVGKNFEKLSKSYVGQPVVCVRCAAGEKEGVAELNVSSYPHLPDWGSDVATLSESETKRWQQLYGAVWHKEQIPVKTLTSVLQKNHIVAIDFLSVDAEGHDLDVLKGLDFSLYQPQMIVVEYNKHRQDIFDHLAARGYFLWLDNGQDLFMVAAQAMRIPTSQSLPEVINFNGSTGRQPYDEIQTAVEMGVHAFINAAAEEIRCFVIVGGYLGWEIERILRIYPNVEIHVFEPSHRYFRPLSERYAGNKRVFCHNLAVSDTNGTAVFHETSLEGTGSLLPMKQKRDGATWIADGATAAENYQVKTVRLDDFDPLAGRNIDLLWCDVQGHEFSVLKGATRVLRTCSAVFLEVAMYKTMYEGQCLFDELNTYLVASNFYLMGIGLCNTGNGTGNALWVNAARHQSITNLAQKAETVVSFDAIRDLVNPHLIAIDYLPKNKPITRKRLEPLSLLSCSRFDIIPKFIYAKLKEFGIDSPWGEEIYEAHLRAFNDCHEGDWSSKSGIETFAGAFDTLLDSVKGNGFDPRQSLVPTGRNGVVIDGAHRVAACLFYRRPMEVLEFDITAKIYNYEFFLNRGLDPEFCDAIALEYCRLNPHAYIVSVFPSAVGGEREIRDILERNGEIFYARQVQFTRLGSVNLVRQMYDGEHWVGSFANRFEGAQNKAAECFRTDGPLRVYVFISDDFEKVKAAKQQIRDLFGISNHSVHINDTHEETVRLGRLLLNANSVHFLNNAQLTTFPRFQAHLDNYKKVLREQAVDGECLCIDGSAVMAAYGIREARDLDYLHFGYDNLTFDYPPELIGSHNSEVAHHVTTRDDIIFNPHNYFYYDGVKFASLGIIRALKQKRGEPKDFEDVALIDRFVTTPPALPHIHTSASQASGVGQTTGESRQPKIVGLVPARNEKHTIGQCLKALSLFTDAIVYLDDASTDKTPDIVASLANECRIERIIRKQEWLRDEPGDRNAMLRAGREIGGTHFIVIDADEILTANLLASPGLRDAILQLQPGDRIALNWIQLWRSVDQYRFDQSVWTWNYKDIIFCDDGLCSYTSEFIHTPRIPGNLSGNRNTVQGYEAGLLHFQFVNWRNLLIKQAWYRCLEHIREPNKPTAEINKRYAPSKDESCLGLAPSPAAWFSGYPFFDRTVYDHPDEWREEQILGWFRKYGRKHFAGLDIWDEEWTASSIGQASSPQATAKQVLVFKESRLAHQLLDGLKGLEIGASAHNPFGLDTRNVGLRIDGYIQEQLGYCGRAVAIDIEAPAHAIPVPDESEDFIVSSHVVEHCSDLVRNLLEWFRVVRTGGYIFMVVPHRNASQADIGRPLTDWAHICEDFRNDVSATTEADPSFYANQHCHVFTPETLKGFIAASFGDRLELIAEQQIDDKVGNGFTLVYCKTRPLAAAYPWSVQAADGGILEMPYLVSHGMNPYRVTAIVSTYRSETFMRGCLEDLLNQTIHRRGELEIIVIDSASPENEGAIVREFQQRSPHIRYIRTDERETIYQAWNRGCKAATGTYITNANTDDRHREDALEVMARELDSHTEAALVYGDVFVTGLPNQTFAHHIRCGYHLRPDYTPEIMLSGCHMGPQPMWRRDIHEVVGWFNGQMRSAGDYEFWCRIALHYTMRHIPKFLGLYFENPVGICNSAMDVSQRETEDVRRRYAGRYPAPPHSYTTNLQYRGTVTATGFVNVGMITYKRLEFTRQAIEALVKVTDYPYVLTVVDNNSEDGTRKYLQQMKTEGVITNLVLLDENIGVAKASNIAWKLEPRANYYLKLDNDIVIQKTGWLTDLVEVVDRLPQVGAVAYNFEPTSYPLRTIEGCKLRIKPEGNLGGACILIPRRTHDLLGFWCEDYGLYGEEDYDYGIRIRLAGLENAYMEDEQIGIHLPAGRAAVINMQSYRASDGIEEELHAEYRAWKDEARRKTIASGILRQNLEAYREGSRSLFVESAFAAAWAAKVSATVPTSSPALKIAVYSLDHPEHACPRIRVFSFAEALAGSMELKWGAELINNHLNIDTSLVAWADLIVVQRFFPTVKTAPFLEQALSTGKPVVYETDDLLMNVPGTNPYQSAADAAKPFIFDLISKAAAVTVSTEEMKRVLAPYNQRIHVLPNLLDERHWSVPLPVKQINDPVVIGYAGTPDHKTDLELMEEVLERVATKYGNRVAFCFMGCSTEKIKRLPGFSSIKFEPGYINYARAIQKAGIDIGLVPLADNTFNRCKSNIKWLEYSACGIAGIYADLPPYNSCIEQGVTGLLVGDDPQKWFNAIDLLIRNTELRRSIVLNARHKVMSEYILKIGAQHWLEVHRDIFEQHRGKRHSAPLTEHTVKVSIIIPVFNQLPFTRQCLEGIFVTLPTTIPFEIIVVDNGSSDGTSDYLCNLDDRITILFNRENLGFAKACNQGGQVACGEILLFINNDTIPKLGWIEALIAAIDNDEADICGARFLYPDGRCQHAGIAFDERGLGYNVFCGFPGDAAPVMERRRMQAITGACLTVRKSLFHELGGFDDGFRNGFEDVDFCLRAGEKGKRILYVPESVLVRYAEQSTGSKDNDILNRQRYFSRWQGKVHHDDTDLYNRFGLTIRRETDGRIIVTPAAKSPVEVSIIIPLFNKAELTRACLQALERTIAKHSYELLLIDNCSSDNTVDLLQEWEPKATIIRNSENRGFAAACNQGARAAKGKYLLFLNNDTEVTAGWLQPLITTLANDPTVAAVGSKLLFPDGTIQHAGVMVVDDKVSKDPLVGKHYYFRFPGNHPPANRMMRMQAVTAACVMIRGTAFRAVGGFDEGYWNGYEDLDLCFKLGCNNGKIIYQPASVVIHHESQSGTERFRRVSDNIRRLHERWLGRIKPDIIIMPDTSVLNGSGILEGLTGIYDYPSHFQNPASTHATTPIEASGRYPLIPLVGHSASSILQKLSSSQRLKGVLRRYTIED